MKKQLLATILALILLASPVVALAASNISLARYWAVIQIKNEATATEAVATTCNISTQNLIDGNYLNSSANNNVIRTSGGTDVPFMPSVNATFPWCIWVPSIGEDSYQSDILYTANSTGGKIRYFPADGGMTTADSDTLELGDNFTIEQKGWVTTTFTDNYTDRNLVYKENAFRTFISGEDNITSEISENITVTQGTRDGNISVNQNEDSRVGQRFNSVKAGTTFTSVGFYLWKTANPVGTGYVRVREVDGDGIIGTLGEINVATLGTNNSVWVDFSTTPVTIPNTQDIRILFEFNSGSAANTVEIDKNSGDVGAGILTAYDPPTYTDTSGQDISYRYKYLVFVTATGVKSGEHTVKTTIGASANTTQVSQSSDDAYRKLNTSAWDLAGLELPAGAASPSHYQLGGGMRFTNITIPQGTTILEAYLVLTCRVARDTLNVKSRISAEDIDDAGTFVDNSATFDARWANRDTERVDWDDIPTWALDEEYTSPDIKTVIQQRVDSPTWVSGYDIVLFWDDFEDRTAHEGKQRQAYSYDGSPAKAPKLLISFPALEIYIDDVLKDTTLLSANVTDNNANWTFLENNVMPYMEYQKIWIGGTLQQHIEWEYDTTFTDLSGKNHDATPTFRGESSDLDVSAEMISFQPVQEAQAPDYVLEEAPAFVTPTSNVTSTFTTTPAKTGGFPLAGVIIAVSEATEMPTPAQLTLLTIAIIIILTASLSVSAVMRKYGSGSVLVKILVIVAVMGVFVGMGNFCIDFWMIFVFATIAIALAMSSRQIGWN